MDSIRSWRFPSHALGILVALSFFVTLSAANNVDANWDHDKFKAFEYDKPLTLQCNISGAAGSQFTLRWLKEDKPIVEDGVKYILNTNENKLYIMKASDEDVGNYTCQAVNAKTNTTENVMKANIQVIGSPKILLAEDTPVVEGERLRLHCNVRGNPTPSVVWSIDDKPVVNSSDGRIKLEDFKAVRNAVLVIDNVQMSDRNHYKCQATNIANHDSKGAEKVTYVRVKDKLAALWPFLGICAEVAVLCTIILIYEKKRNKTELDESDTDQSPEQKNTPDHGKDVRQRK